MKYDGHPLFFYMSNNCIKIRWKIGRLDLTHMVNIASIVIFVFIIILKYGRLSFYDIGIKKNRLLSAAAAILIIWISMQLLNIVFTMFISGKPIIYSGWAKYGASKMFGSFIGQLFGNSLFEEMAFRGFLLVQVCKKLKGIKGGFLTGAAVSQLLFTLIHIPNRILSERSLSLDSQLKRVLPKLESTLC